MTATYDPELIDRLVREAREDDERMTDAPLLAIQEDDETGEYYEIVDNRGFGVIDSMSKWDAIGFARTRNNLAAITDQLEAARREIKRMRVSLDAVNEANDRLTADVVLMRPVVVRAELFRDALRDEDNDCLEEDRALWSAVDNYRAAKGKT